MKELPPLAKWAPKELVEMYLGFNKPNMQLLDKNFPQVKEALYRLGTNIDMKECWGKLLAKEATLPRQELVGTWMVTQIYMLLTDVFLRAREVLTPQFKKKEIEKIVEMVNKLIIAIHNSSEALGESFFIVKTELSREIIEKNPEKSRGLGCEVAPIASWSFISGVRDVLDSVSEFDSLEPHDWDSWSSDKKTSWLLSRIKGLDLTTVLRTYLEQLKDIPSSYASNYIAANRATVTKGLFEVLYKSYDDYMPDCVAPMVNAILDLELGIEDITPYKPKEKNS